MKNHLFLWTADCLYFWRFGAVTLPSARLRYFQIEWPGCTSELLCRWLDYVACESTTRNDIAFGLKLSRFRLNYVTVGSEFPERHIVSLGECSPTPSSARLPRLCCFWNPCMQAFGCENCTLYRYMHSYLHAI